jgi:FtsH-binding integral membrane protein
VADPIVARLNVEGVLLGLLVLLFLFRRQLFRHWRIAIPLIVSFLGGLIFVGFFLRSESTPLPPIVVVLLTAVAGVWILRILQDLFK